MNEILVELLSEKVHAAWMKAKKAQGVESRQSETGEELMVPYADLTEGAKDLDRYSVKAVLGALPQGLLRIIDERMRQIANEGYSLEHDAQYQDNELERAAACYLMFDAKRVGVHGGKLPWQYLFPWDEEHWKPAGHERNLEKAGALIAAALDQTS